LPLVVYLADSSGGLIYTQADFRSPLALIMGSEAEGAGIEAQSLADARVHISMPGEAESLNAAIAAAILMFEVVRQRGI
jgi:TrmH family RNA methyltransferase